MCWDNFFCAFSGASAALLGITFAFIIAKLLNHISEFNELNKLSQDLLIEAKKLKINISNIYYQWHDEMLLKYKYKIKQQIENNQINSMQTEKELINYINKNFNRIFYPKNCISFIHEEIIKYQEQLKSTKNGISFIPAQALTLQELPMDMNIWKEINEEEEKVNTYRQDSYLLIDKFNYLIDRINCKIKDLIIIKNIIIIFMPIIVITVIYPLHFVPLIGTQAPQISFSFSNFLSNLFCLKGILLTFLFIATIGSLAYFAILSLKYIKKYKEKKEYISINHLDISFYSDLFTEKNPD